MVNGQDKELTTVECSGCGKKYKIKTPAGKVKFNCKCGTENIVEPEPEVGVVVAAEPTEEDAQQAVKNASKAMAQAHKENRDITQTREYIRQARAAMQMGDYGNAINLSNIAMNSLEGGTMPEAGPATAVPAPSPLMPGPEQMPVQESKPAKGLTKGELITMIGGAMMFVGFFLPWIGVPDILMFTGLGLVALSALISPIYMLLWSLPMIFGLLALVLPLAKKALIGGIFGFIGFILLFIPIIAMGIVFAETGSASVFSLVSYGWYICLIGGLLGFCP